MLPVGQDAAEAFYRITRPSGSRDQLSQRIVAGDGLVGLREITEEVMRNLHRRNTENILRNYG
jgi:hypothetical protein